ncbi:putative quinol monooxygenase [Streptomyces sp. cg40]|uniref:putative quinol monooxygenase n=1 Tax=Streptomyces sp. cg40 TaxID=3419764 RepID=UPI003D0602D2
MAYVVTATWTAQPGKEHIVRDAIEKLTPPSRQEPGNRFYQAFQDPAEPLVFRLFEIYDDEDAYLAHGASEHFAEYGHGVAIPVLAGRERAFYETIG